MKVKRKIIKIDEERCDGCGQCVTACAEGTLEIIDGKAKVISDNLCDGLGACIGECPNDALEIVEREAEEFNEEAVEKRLSELGRKEPAEEPMACGCPSANILDFRAAGQTRVETLDTEKVDESALSHWPVKIRLVPSNAPFLKGADLLVLADCVPAAYPDLHKKLLKGRAVMMGCPKFDQVQEYVDKFEKICRHSGVKRITTVIMDVPCCSGLHTIVRRGLAASGAQIPLEEVIIDRRGVIVQHCKVA
jgi:NAD-dependent dihydropyrimidine dehydrogenase PreA subunit